MLRRGRSGHPCALVATAAACGLLVAACGGAASESTQQRTVRSPATTATVQNPPTTTEQQTDPLDQRLEQIADSLPLTEQAGQLVITKLSAPQLLEEERLALQRGRLGGVIVFDFGYDDPEQLAALVGDVQQVARASSSARLAMLVAADQEGGPVRTFDDLPPAASHRELGAADDPRRAREQARSAGQLLAAHGVNVVLAPVADLALPPRRIMAGRSFGDQAEEVAPLVSAWTRGAQAGGVAATPKHFPGFGGASENSDLGVARIDRTREQLLNEDVAAFVPALQHAHAVMISHGIYAGLDSSLPASLAPEVVEPLLRQRLGYDGVAMTDSLNARGLREAWGRSVPEACAQAIRVGVDIALVTGSMETALLCRREIVRGVRDGSISRERLREALLRVLRLKAELDLLPAASG